MTTQREKAPKANRAPKKKGASEEAPHSHTTWDVTQKLAEIAAMTTKELVAYVAGLDEEGKRAARYERKKAQWTASNRRRGHAPRVTPDQETLKAQQRERWRRYRQRLIDE